MSNYLESLYDILPMKVNFVQEMFECIKKKNRWFMLSESLGMYSSKRAMVYLPKYYSEDQPKVLNFIR